jgi:nucleoporin p58/p45
MYPHSAAAFGIKSQAPANTALFGQSNAAQPQGSIFGSVQPSTSGFGNQSQPQTQGSSLFGGAFGQNQNQQQQNQPASTGLFGQPAGQQPNQQPALTGLFGQPTAGTQQQQQQPQQNTFGSSLFGGSTNQPQGQPSAFGSSNQQSTFSGWGGSTGGTNPLQAQATLPAGSNAFNSGASANPAVGSSLFAQPPRQQS